MNLKSKSILLAILIWIGVVGVSFSIQFFTNDLGILTLTMVEQTSTLLFGLVLIVVIAILQFGDKFPALCETKWFVFHVIISVFSYLAFQALFVEVAILPGNDMTFVHKTSSFGNALLDNILGNGFGIYAITLLIFSLIYGYFSQTQQTEKKSALSLPDKIKVKLANRTYFLPKDEILFIKSSNNYTDLYTEEGKHVIRESIGNLENELDPNVFMRIHRSIIIKIDQVTEFISNGNGDYRVKLKNEETFNIGNKYKESVVTKFGL